MIEISGTVHEVSKGSSINVERSQSLIDSRIEIAAPGVDDTKVYVRVGDSHRSVRGAIRASMHLDGLAGVLFGAVIISKPCVAGGGVENPLGVVKNEVVVGVVRHWQAAEHLGSAGQSTIGFAAVPDAGKTAGFLEGELDHGAAGAGHGLAHAGGGNDVFIAAFDEGEPR
ncbi:hypothetical protein BKM31_42425 [[Actinomadura] parvosata subsp. kistnae]|uniref:Uncharacterized protein n=1 Tax=[Actinomadura] parvosata subsp. kistnae TaxID=1909395 RepID=A0A1V0AAK3_9ACTN|nr:hypothetical protein BKM31_42425 [Nonomuraea sp. ATCC 55076]